MTWILFKPEKYKERKIMHWQSCASYKYRKAIPIP